jgi:hypothetical protein
VEGGAAVAPPSKKNQGKIGLVFSGGSYDEVARWLKNFLTSHAKREHPRVEVVLEDDDALQGRAYRARLRLGERVSGPMELAYQDVADHRGTLTWCTALATGARTLARGLVGAGSGNDARVR